MSETQSRSRPPSCDAQTASSPLSSVVFTRSGVGLEAVLPCEWGSHNDVSSATPYIQWQTLRNMVFERMGPAQFQAEAYQNRTDVPEAVLARGNCSLHLSDIRFSDAGIYECYLVVGKSGSKQRIFIQSVQLSVLDHKSTRVVEMGKDLTLDLYTSQAETVVFQSSNGDEWRELWKRQGNSSRVEKRDRKLVIRNVRASDEGIYKVIDGEGLALSTVKVSVQEPPRPTRTNMVEKRVSFESSVGVNSPSLSLGFLLIMLLYLL
ncbi:CD276 antigen isoform X2 [Ictalurus furcatus]|uniref:CD276 antigen isoform X2 n=1 Tax=Ictalurus furcatus TaxID=66913 RepID=UPI00234FEB81|nr:CD276 antigen isoform X2 [Ictalurus furcatus]XP_053498079.1 CD276 antigen isoform X2 [Ictalurus furcatus]